MAKSLFASALLIVACHASQQWGYAPQPNYYAGYQ